MSNISKPLFCAVTDLPLSDLNEDQISKLHFRVFCSFAITRKIDLTRITNKQGGSIEKDMNGTDWIPHAINEGILYHA